MRRAILLTAGAAAVVVAGAVTLVSSRSQADPARRGPEEAAARQAQLPIGQVVLFSSGVGYFQREGVVEGDARVDLSFPVSDINDLLKSLVLRDLDGGHVAAVSYDSNAPLERTLKSFALNLTSNPSLAQLLNQARGEKVEVALQQAASGQQASLSGAIVGLEKQKLPSANNAALEADVLNLWCADGLRAVKLADVQRVRFLNPTLESEFRKALEALAQAHDTQKKAVGIAFQGEGRRQVRVGYVIESPIWKTSYRLVLAKAKEDKPFLQGWAVVENTTDEDWRDVRMALVSGRPISFQMDLYQPLFVTRPVVEPELFASLRPVAYSGKMDDDEKAAATAPGRTAPAKEDQKAGEAAGAERGKAMLGGLARNAPADSTYALRLQDDLGRRMNLAGSGVVSAATAARLGDYFQYALDRPVSLPRQKSALLPIVNKDVAGTRLSIYNEQTQPKFPLLGLRFRNTSGLHLMQGPITVFEGSSYAGDARILDLQPGEERLLSYAVDLGTEVNPVPSSDNGRIVEVKAVKGLLHTQTKLRETKTYAIKNRNDQDRLVLVEHPVRNDFKLVDGARPAETASDVYRFEVNVAPGKTETLAVTEERTLTENVQLTNLNDDQVRFFISQTATSARVKEGLRKALDLRGLLARTQREIQEQERQLKAITDDQVRLRANLREMPATAAAYKRYLQKFDQQETTIEKYQQDIKALQQTEHTQKKALEDFLAAFSAE
jgi:hypothetical protein